MDSTASSSHSALSGKERRVLRARAHRLKPSVWIAESGITPGALREIDRALNAHELIKIHSATQGRDARATLLAGICTDLEAQPVQVIGKMLVAFRPRLDPDPVAKTPVATATARQRPRKSKATPRSERQQRR
jgi:RNA-binding protein